MPNFLLTQEDAKKIKSGSLNAAVILVGVTISYFFCVLINLRAAVFSHFNIAVVCIGYQGLLIYGSIIMVRHCLEVRRLISRAAKEPTVFERIYNTERETELHEAEKKRAEKETERLSAEHKRLKAEYDLACLRGSRAPDEEVPAYIREIQEKVSKVAEYAKAEAIVDDAKAKYPGQAELLDVILQNQRSRLMREEKP